MSNAVIVILSVYLIVMMIFSFYRGREFNKLENSLLKSLVPNWRFFESLKPLPILYYRFGSTTQSLGVWRRLVLPRQRRWLSFFYNSQGNFQLYQNTLISNLSAELLGSASPVDIESLAEFYLVKSWIEDQVPANSYYQFKIMIEEFETSETEIIQSTIISRTQK